MAKVSQNIQIVPPNDPELGKKLQDMSAGIQGNMDDLYNAAHTHDQIGTVPSDTDGSVGDIELVDTGTNQYLYVRFSSGWKRFVPA